jgi:hypothetical protein
MLHHSIYRESQIGNHYSCDSKVDITILRFWSHMIVLPYKFGGVAIAKRQAPNIAPNEYGCRIWLSHDIPMSFYQE